MFIKARKPECSELKASAWKSLFGIGQTSSASLDPSENMLMMAKNLSIWLESG